jgi:hypothetical protein
MGCAVGVWVWLTAFGEPVSKGPVQFFIINRVENRRGIECWGCVSCKNVYFFSQSSWDNVLKLFEGLAGACSCGWTSFVFVGFLVRSPASVC